MLQTQATSFTVTFNKLIIGGFLILLVGVGGGYALQKFQAMSSSASAGGGCASQNWDVAIYADHLANILRRGGKISQMQMNNLIDLMEIRDECEADWAHQQLLALK